MSTTETKQEKATEELKKAIEGLPEKTIEESTKEPIKNSKKIILGIIISFCILLAIYFGITKYFTNHFYFGSEINSINVSGKTAEEAKIAVEAKLQNYTLNLKERGGKSEQIKAGDVGLKCNPDQDFNKLKDTQDPYKWFLTPFNTKSYKMTIGLSYNNNRLKEKVDKLSGISSDSIVEPKNPSFQFENNKYVIINEVLGNKVNKDTLFSNVVNSMLNGKTEINLESAGCYINPQYTSKSNKTLEVQDILNKYVSSKITYNIRGSKETLDGSMINKWLKVDENLQITFDIKKIKSYFYTLSNTYDTVGKTRTFVTTSGSSINISGGDYGWSIDSNKEAQNLIKNIENGKTITKEPAYIQTSFVNSNSNNDIGTTYVEINLEMQHLWFYKNGSLVVQGDIVSGNVSSNHSTPTGIYSLKYKERDTKLKGQDYDSPVSFWMPFNEGIGIHDANWRDTFGGNIYQTQGSHGCINSPYDLASTIFNNIDQGTPIICY